MYGIEPLDRIAFRDLNIKSFIDRVRERYKYFGMI